MNRRNAWILPVIVSAVIGIIVGILFYNAIISVEIIATPIIFATIFAVISLILLFLGISLTTRRDVKECINYNAKPLIVGIFGTLATGFIGLTFFATLVAGRFLIALLIGLGAFFFILTFITLVLLTICLVNNVWNKKDDNCKYDYNI